MKIMNRLMLFIFTKPSAGLLSLVFLSLIFSGCSAENFPEFTKLEKLRILALSVDTPELQNPAAGVNNISLSPYISDVGGSGTVRLEIQSCLDPGASLGQTPSCSGALYASSVQSVTVTAPGGQADGTFGSPERTGIPSTGAITVGLTIPPSLLLAYASAIQFNGVAYLITVTATAGSQSVRAFRRVLISNKPPNTNPTISAFFQNGNPLTSLPTRDTELSFSIVGSPENYNFLSDEGNLISRTETMEVTWFVSDGSIANPRTTIGQSTIWNVPGGAPSGRKVVLVGVLRDGRGGMNVLTKTF